MNDRVTELERLAASDQFRTYLRAKHPSMQPLLAGPGRRRLLQIMAASFALGGLSDCARPDSSGYDEIIPYVRQPTALTPTVPLSYTSAALLDDIANGVLVTTIDGRPIKVEGNPDHPWSRGGTDVFAQASVLDLYDPDRSQAVSHLGTVSDWDTFQAAMLAHFGDLKAASGRRLRLLTGPVSSPSLIARIERMRETLPDMHWHTHAPVGREMLYAGAHAAFGRPLETRWDFANADLIVSLDGDFLDAGPQQIGASMAWIEARRKSVQGGKLLEMYSIAPAPSLTHAKADHHQPAAQRDLLALAHALAAEISEPQGGEGTHADWRRRVASALRAAHGRSIVLTGTHQSPELHEAVHRLNAALGNIGRTVFYTDPVLAQAEPLADLVNAMQAGQVSTLLMLGTNPVQTAPTEANFLNLLSKVQVKLHAGLYLDETGMQCDWHLPLKHPLESWADARALDGSVTVLQPTIAPLYHGRTHAEILSVLIDAQPRPALAMLREYWRGQMAGRDFDTTWRQTLLSGFVPDSAFQPVSVSPASPGHASRSASSGLQVVLRPDPTLWDGSFSNNAWLQELPKPLTKIVWQNVIWISPELASKQNLANGDVCIVEAHGHVIEGAVWAVPGQDAETIVVHLGYGRRHVGAVGDGIGFDVYPLRRFDALWTIDDVKLSRGKGSRDIATAQQLDDQEGQDYVRLQPVGGAPVGDDTSFTQPTLYKREPNDGRAWGMVIDLDACIGCNACVVACQAENNIPVVGEDEFRAGRDMHWLRIDRYYEGGKDNPDTRFMPVPCMQCETAPCELGCPVEATLHDSEGLNLMVYNRCVGTRACNAYCPYKVRHFNFLHYSDAGTSIEAQRNPAVSVRARGVMEKCTYCVQRIVAGRIAADKENRSIRDGEVVTACAAACPTRAIVFGDLADKTSAVAAARGDSRNYALLGELNTRPRTTYLAAFVPPDEKA